MYVCVYIYTHIFTYYIYMCNLIYLFIYLFIYLYIWLYFFFPKQFTVGVLNSLLNRCPALSKWWCRALQMSPVHVSPLLAIHLSPSLAGGVRLFGCLQFICPPL